MQIGFALFTLEEVAGHQQRQPIQGGDPMASAHRWRNLGMLGYVEAHFNDVDPEFVKKVKALLDAYVEKVNALDRAAGESATTMPAERARPAS